MNKTSKAKKTATLSIVRSMTSNWRRRFGMNRTSLSIRNNRKVLNTDKPELLSPPSVNKPWNSSTKLNAHENSSISLKSQNQEKKLKRFNFL